MFHAAASFSAGDRQDVVWDKVHTRTISIDRLFGKHEEEESICLHSELSEAAVCVRILGFGNMFLKVACFPALFLLGEESCLRDHKTS